MNQKKFNQVLNHLIAPIGALSIAKIFTLILNIFVAIIGIPFAKDSVYVLPLDSFVDNLCSGFTTIAFIISVPFFIRGINILKKNVNINAHKKRS